MGKKIKKPEKYLNLKNPSLRDVFKKTAGLPEINPHNAFLTAPALFRLVFKIKRLCLRPVYRFLVKPVGAVIIYIWRRALVGVMEPGVSLGHFNATLQAQWVSLQNRMYYARIPKYLLAGLRPAGFWGYFFALFSSYWMSAHIFRAGNRRREPTAASLTAEAVAALFTGLPAEAFDAAFRALRRGADNGPAALVLAHSAAGLHREVEAAAILRLSSFGAGLAAVLLTGANKTKAAAALLLEHAASFPQDAEAAADYMLLILNRRAESLRLYDLALTQGGPRAIKFKRALALPMFLNSTEEIIRTRKAIYADLLELKNNPEPGDLERYFAAVCPPISLMGTNLDSLYPIIFHEEKDVGLTLARAACFVVNFPELNFKAPHTLKYANISNQKIKVGFFIEAPYPQLNIFYRPFLERLSKDNFHLTLFLPQGLPHGLLPGLKDWADKITEYPYPRATIHTPVARESQKGFFAETRSLVAAAELDVFYNPFIGQDLMSQFLAYARLAPVQIFDEARLTTTGLPEIDYYLTHNGDFIAEPAEYFTEKLALLAGNNQYLLDSLRAGEPETAALKRADFKLPEKAVIYLCVQDLTRRHPEMDEIIAKLLKLDPDGLLAVSDYGTPGIFTDFIANLKKWGLNGAESRIRKVPVFSGVYPKSHYYAYLGLADANLAMRGMCGGTIFYDCLQLALPQIVWPFPTVANATAAFYRRLGLDKELFAASVDDYVKKAYRLAHDKKWKAALKNELRWKLQRFARKAAEENVGGDMARFLTAAVERARSGSPPAHWHNGRFYENLSAAQLREFAETAWSKDEDD